MIHTLCPALVPLTITSQANKPLPILTAPTSTTRSSSARTPSSSQVDVRGLDLGEGAHGEPSLLLIGLLVMVLRWRRAVLRQRLRPSAVACRCGALLGPGGASQAHRSSSR